MILLSLSLLGVNVNVVGGAWPLLEEIGLSYNRVGDAGKGVGLHSSIITMIRPSFVFVSMARFHAIPLPRIPVSPGPYAYEESLLTPY